MRLKRPCGEARRNGGPGLVMLTALVASLLAGGAPAQATTHLAVFGGFGGTFPGTFLNGGTLHTEDSFNSFHVFSSAIAFDVDTGAAAGEGVYTMALGTTAGGADLVIQGRWEARKLRAWKSIGLCRDNATCLGVGFPDGFNAGKMRAKIRLFDASGKKVGNAVLTIWCSLPGIPYGVDRRDPDGRGIEQYRVRVASGPYKGLVFEVGRSGTVFIDLSVP